jgi:hypothetical protein
MSIHVTPPPARPLPEGILPADHLRITEDELAALLWTREALSSGLMQHDPNESHEFPYGFNMNVPLSTEGGEECGTVGCIGGWMYHYLHQNKLAPVFNPNGIRNTGFSSNKYVQLHRSAALHELFYPLSKFAGNSNYDIDYAVIPTEWALEAIDNFLTAGDPEWDVVTCQA